MQVGHIRRDIPGTGGDGMMDAEQQVLMWHDSKWGDKEERILALKLAEECGEVAGAYIKEAEGRLTSQDIRDEIGDVLVVLHVLAGRRGWNLSGIFEDRFGEVRHR